MSRLKKELLMASEHKSSCGQKGVSLYLTLVIMGILLALALGISIILVGEIKITRGMGDSVIAFYAADTGIEGALYEDADENYATSGILDLNGDSARYEVEGLAAGEEDCPSTPETNFCIKSIGMFKETRRAIRIDR